MIEHKPDPDATEPLWSVATITALCAAGLGLLVAFGLPVDDEQQAQLLGLLAAVAPVVVAAWGRRRVYAPATVARLLRR